MLCKSVAGEKLLDGVLSRGIGDPYREDMDEKRGNIVLVVIHSLTFKTVRIQGQIGATGKFLSPTNHNPSEIAFICPCGGCNALWKVVATKGI